MKRLIYFSLCGLLIGFTSAFSQEVKQTKTSKKKNPKVKVIATKDTTSKNATAPVKGVKTSDDVKPNSDVKSSNDTKRSSETKAVTANTDGGNINSGKEEILINKSKPIISEKTNGSINWTQQYIEARGSSVLDTSRFKNPAQARAMATRGAVVVAQRNLLEIIKGVEVTSETTVQDMVATNDYIYTRIDGVVKGAQQIGQAIMKDGMIEVTMRVPLYAQDGLAPAIYESLAKGKDNAPNTEVSNGKASERLSAPSSENNLVAGSGDEMSLEKIAFKLSGKKFNPSMFPVIIDENKNVVLDLAKIYNPVTGKFPKIIQASKEVLDAAGYKDAVQWVDVLETGKGKITIGTEAAKKINWGKIGKTAATIGKFLMLVI